MKAKENFFAYHTSGDVIFIYWINTSTSVAHGFNLVSPTLRAKNYPVNKVNLDKSVQPEDVIKVLGKTQYCHKPKSKPNVEVRRDRMQLVVNHFQQMASA